MDNPNVPTPVNDPNPDAPKASWFWLKDSSGFPSVSVTLVTVSFWVTTIIYIASAIGKIGPIEICPFDAAATSAYLIPILTLYFTRRFTDAKFGVTQSRDANVLNSLGVNSNNQQ